MIQVKESVDTFPETRNIDNCLNITIEIMNWIIYTLLKIER